MTDDPRQHDGSPADGSPGDGSPALRSRRSGPRRELRAVHALVHRELLRLIGERTRTALVLVQPVFYLLLLGGGLASVIPDRTVGGDYRAFLFPGVLVMTVQAPAMGVGMRLIIDRESGYLRETLMAPVRRSTLLYGSCLGGTTVATTQGVLLLALTTGLIGLPYHPALLAVLLLGMILTAFTFSALTLALAVRIRTVETFGTVLGLAMMPLLFLSGAFFPLTALPSWVAVLTSLNPLSYAVDALRRCIMHYAPGHRAVGGPEWAGWQPPVPLELGVLAAAGAGALLWAARRFARPE
ncbi:ABC transporter [Streptomyces armeniacus]|uniref:Transport permease protein n=1 Tax=Streptomyces armeniacus TaxID=83291 RepID=A0A345Y001_9ACTN|nr:ABC transporter [Streptomyces armeniacus]